MASGSDFPGSLDSFTDRVRGNDVDVDLINKLKNAVENAQAKLGATDSAVTTSHDYKLANIAKNLYTQSLINGNFDIWQRRGASAFTNPGNGLYTADRWVVFNATGGGTAPSVNVIRNDSVFPSNNKSKYSCRLNVTASGSPSSSTYWVFVQKIEDFEKFKGKRISFSIFMKADSGLTLGMRILDGVSNQTVLKTITTSFAEYKFENVLVSASATLLEIIIDVAYSELLGYGSNDNPPTGGIYFSQAQMNVGDKAFSFQPKSAGVELELCRRYFQKIAVFGQADGTDVFFISCALPVSMYKTPVVYKTETYLEVTNNVWDLGVGSVAISWDTLTADVDTLTRLIDGSSPFTDGHFMTALVELEAEL